MRQDLIRCTVERLVRCLTPTAFYRLLNPGLCVES